MKKILIVLFAIFMALTVTGCSKKETETESGPIIEIEEPTQEVKEEPAPEPEVAEEVVEATAELEVDETYLQTDLTLEQKAEYYTNLHKDMSLEDKVKMYIERVGRECLVPYNNSYKIVDYQSIPLDILAEMIYDVNFPISFESNPQDGEAIYALLGIEI